MSDTDNDIILNAGTGGAGIKTFYETTAGETGHYQLMMLSFDDAAATADIASMSNPFPVMIPPTADTVGGFVNQMYNGLTTDGAGGTAFKCDVSYGSGITVNAIVEDLIVGITANKSFAQIGVYGTGGTAVGITGSVYIIDTNVGVTSSSGIAVFGTGGTAMNVATSGDAVGITSTSGIAVFGTGGTAMNIAGTCSVNSASLVGISGGAWPVTIDSSVALNVNIAPGFTTGRINGDISGMSGSATSFSFASYGLSSGVRINAFSTGATTDFIYVGGTTDFGSSTLGLTSYGYPLREGDSLFIETDNLNTVYLQADNTSVDVRWIAS
jgi:hypothetical protein